LAEASLSPSFFFKLPEKTPRRIVDCGFHALAGSAMR
jgi:hypothetical protein